jgi:hypothetical protein
MKCPLGEGGFQTRGGARLGRKIFLYDENDRGPPLLSSIPVRALLAADGSCPPEP